MISFNVPPCVGMEMDYIKDAIQAHKISGDGKYTRLCSEWLERQTGGGESTTHDLLYSRDGNGSYPVRYTSRR